VAEDGTDLVTMNSDAGFSLIDSIIAYESDELGSYDTLVLFAHLIATGQAWTLQGSYGRTAANMIEAELITRYGVITAEGETYRESTPPDSEPDEDADPDPSVKFDLDSAEREYVTPEGHDSRTEYLT
jgi:hypothetical protein